MISVTVSPKGYEGWLRRAIQFITDVFKDDALEPGGGTVKVVSFNVDDAGDVRSAEEFLVGHAELPPSILLAILEGKIFFYLVKEGAVVAPVNPRMVDAFGTYALTEPLFHEFTHRVTSVNEGVLDDLVEEVIGEAPIIELVKLSGKARKKFTDLLYIFTDELFATYAGICYLRYLRTEPCINAGKLMVAEKSVMNVYNALCALGGGALGDDEGVAFCRDLYPPNLTPLLATTFHDVFTSVVKAYPAEVAGRFSDILNGRERYIKMKEHIAGAEL